MPFTLYGLLPELIRRFRTAHPEVEMSLSELTTVQQADALKAGRIDVDYRPLAEAGVVSPVIMSCRTGDRSVLLERFRELVADRE